MKSPSQAAYLRMLSALKKHTSPACHHIILSGLIHESAKKLTAPAKALQNPLSFSQKPHDPPTSKHANMIQNPKPSHAFTVEVIGPLDRGDDVGHRDHLLSQLEEIPRDIPYLQIEENTPSNTEWSLLGNHFTSIKNLETNSGFHELLNDEKMPLHWPLERLLISSACSEVVSSRFITEGRVKHLILLLTHGLRFEGPTTTELCRANEEAIARGEKKPTFVTTREGTPEEKKVELVSVPELTQQWMREKYAKQDRDSEANGNRAATSSSGPQSEVEPERASAANHQQVLFVPDEVTSDTAKLEILEILENDAMDTFTRMTLGLPHVVLNLSTLNIRSTSGLDFQFTHEDIFSQLLPQLTELKTLVLSVGEVFTSDTFLPTFYKHFPQSLSTLRFRGPVSLATSDQWTNWIDSFASSDFLPELKRLSFVLDLHYEATNRYPRTKLIKAPDEMLIEAQDACKQLHIAAERRGVVVEPFHDEWAGPSKLFEQVDERWMNL